MSAELPTKIQLGLDELAVICEQMSPLIARTHEPDLPLMETAAACAMLHSFYTEIQEILKMVALDRDRKMPSSESWHRDLLTQMAASTENRPPVIQQRTRKPAPGVSGIPSFVSRSVDGPYEVEQALTAGREGGSGALGIRSRTYSVSAFP